jgi:hypothetical protein
MNIIRSNDRCVLSLDWQLSTCQGKWGCSPKSYQNSPRSSRCSKQSLSHFTGQTPVYGSSWRSCLTGSQSKSKRKTDNCSLHRPNLNRSLSPAQVLLGWQLSTIVQKRGNARQSKTTIWNNCAFQADTKFLRQNSPRARLPRTTHAFASNCQSRGLFLAGQGSSEDNCSSQTDS